MKWSSMLIAGTLDAPKVQLGRCDGYLLTSKSQISGSCTEVSELSAYQYEASIWVPEPGHRAALKRLDVLKFAVC